MVNNRGFIIHKANHKKGKRHDYDVYKRNRPVTPKQVVNVIDLGYLGGIEKISRTTIAALPHKKKRNHPKYIPSAKRVWQNSFQKEDNSGTYYL